MSHLNIERLKRETWISEVEHFAELDSTNNLAQQRGEELGVALPRLILADRQTAGRGRGSNRWWTGPGALAFSLLLDPRSLLLHSPLPEVPASELQRRAGLMALAAGLATIHAVQQCLPSEQVGLHWPNDVYVGKKKLAGILVEAPRPDRVILGIGLNTNNTLETAPAHLIETVATLRELTGQTHDHTTILIDLLNRLGELLKILITDPAKIGRAANDKCLQRGEPLTLESGNHTAQGTCVGIADDGALLLDTSDGQKSFYSGTLG